MKKNIRSIMKYAAPFKKSFIIGMILAFVGAVLKMLVPDQINHIMDYLQQNISGPIEFTEIARYGIIAASFILMGFLLDSLQGVILSASALKMSCLMKKKVNAKLDRLPVKFFITRKAGDIQSRVTNDIDSVSNAMSNNLASITISVTTLVVCLIMMFKTNLILSAVTIANSFVGLVITVIIAKKSRPHAMKQQVLMGAVNSEVYESFSGHLVIKAFNCESDVTEHFRKTNHELSESGWKASFFQSIMMPVMSFVSNMGFIVVAVAGTILMFSGVGNTSIGDLMVFILYSASLTNPLKDLATASAALQPAMVAIERVEEIMNEPDEVDDPDAKEIKTVKGDVVFENVKFGYLPDQIILHDLNATVKAGQKVAIVGPTGAGKSTMVNLLMRFYNTDSGRILLDGVPITDYTNHSLHSMLGMVLQDTWTFEGTIRDNIVYSADDVSEQRLNEIISDIGLKHFVDTLPNGLDTVLSETSAVSAGQKQLITIGRAMAKNAPVLILDEATSSVDTRTEKLIQNALDLLTEGRTSFVIAHRLSTIRNADQIFVMKDGNVVEIGKHDELLSQNGLYAELYNSQFAGA